MSIKENYEKIKEKYNLPEFEELDKYFDINEIDLKDKEVNNKKILKNIRENILLKIELLIDFFSSVIYFDSESYSVYEAGNFSKKEKNEMFKIFKNLMYIKRSGFKLSIETNEEKDAEFIKMSFERYLSIKDQMIELIDKIKDSWVKDENEEKKYEYFG
ncbi:MAG: hypothetical protein ACP5H9_01115 [Candidatus Woesearchaeota archaeon]